MLPVELHPSAVNDLRRIRGQSPKAAGQLAAVIQEMKADPHLHDKLLEHDATADYRNVKHWWERYKEGDNLWRLRLLEPSNGPLLSYRIIYGYIPYGNNQQPRYCVLAIVHRGDFNYDATSELGQRIIRDYESLLL